MATKNTELYFDPISAGICEIVGCANPAKYRATWSQGVVTRIVCVAHKPTIEGKRFDELSSSTFESTRRAR
jgi:hypothetical protein